MIERSLHLLSDGTKNECFATQTQPDSDMIGSSLRSKAYAVSALLMMCIVALIQEKDSLVGLYVTTDVGGSLKPLNRWMESCGFELYPNLKWETVMSYHGSNRPAMTVFVPFAVENNWAVWDSPDVDDSDFHGCPTSCVWIRSRDTSMEGLRRSAR